MIGIRKIFLDFPAGLEALMSFPPISEYFMKFGNPLIDNDPAALAAASLVYYAIVQRPDSNIRMDDVLSRNELIVRVNDFSIQWDLEQVLWEFSILFDNETPADTAKWAVENNWEIIPDD